MFGNFDTRHAEASFDWRKASTSYPVSPVAPFVARCPSSDSQMHMLQNRALMASFPEADYVNPPEAPHPYGLQVCENSFSGASGIPKGDWRLPSHVAGSPLPLPLNQVPVQFALFYQPVQKLQPSGHFRRICSSTSVTTSSGTGNQRSVASGRKVSEGSVNSGSGGSRTLFIENIPQNVSLKEVINFFQKAGRLEFNERTGQLNVRLIVKRGIPTGEAVVQYASESGVKNALTMFTDNCFPPNQLPLKLTIAHGPYWRSNIDSTVEKLNSSLCRTPPKLCSTGKHKQRIILRGNDKPDAPSKALLNGKVKGVCTSSNIMKKRDYQMPYLGLPKLLHEDVRKTWLCWQCLNKNSGGDICLFCHRKDSIGSNGSAKSAEVIPSSSETAEALNNPESSAGIVSNRVTVLPCKEQTAEALSKHDVAE